MAGGSFSKGGGGANWSPFGNTQPSGAATGAGYLAARAAVQTTGRYQTEAGAMRYGKTFYQYPPTGSPVGYVLDPIYGWSASTPPDQGNNYITGRPTFTPLSGGGCCGGNRDADRGTIFPDRTGGGGFAGDSITIQNAGGIPGWHSGGGNSYNVAGANIPSQDAITDSEPLITGKEVLKAILMALIVSAAIYWIKRKAV